MVAVYQELTGIEMHTSARVRVDEGFHKESTRHVRKQNLSLTVTRVS